MEVLPSGDVAFSGHVNGGATVAVPVLAMAVNPSTVTPTLTTAAWIAAVSLEETTSVTASVSTDWLRSRRFADSNSRRATPRVDAAAVPVTGSLVLTRESVWHTIVTELIVLMDAMATLVPVTYSGSMLIVGTHSSAVTTTNS
jgi:hypothetical protein